MVTEAMIIEDMLCDSHFHRVSKHSRHRGRQNRHRKDLCFIWSALDMCAVICKLCALPCCAQRLI